MAKKGDNDKPTIIIKRVKKGGHHAHHGGAWKVAYADFVTAMMAFFLLLWLLNATTEEQKKGISDYFAPSSISRSTSGSGGILGGRTLSRDGAMTSERASQGLTMALPALEDQQEVEDQERSSGETDLTGTGSLDAETAERLREAAAEREERLFEAIEEQLREQIEASPELEVIKDNVMIDQAVEGLRIQIVDKEGQPMFPLGSARLYERTRELIHLVARTVRPLENRIMIKGHTDAAPYTSNNGYTNWELSSDRANASRRALIDGGLPRERIDSVVGRAAEEPMLPDDPYSPRNRRIAIILLREAPRPQ